MFRSIVISQLFFICQLYLADGADDLEAHGAGLELGPLGLLVPLRVTPLRVDLLLPAGHPSAAATLSVAGGLLLSHRRSDSDRRPPWPVEGESGFFFALGLLQPFPQSNSPYMYFLLYFTTSLQKILLL